MLYRGAVVFGGAGMDGCGVGSAQEFCDVAWPRTSPVYKADHAQRVG